MKHKGFLIAVILVLSVLANIWGAQSKGDPTPEQFVTELQTWYGHTNDGYFDGNLPTDTVVFYQAPPDETRKVLGETQLIQGRFYIYINPYYARDLDTAKEIELHEMCHISVYGKDNFDDHGKVWNACMHRLADLGAMEGIW